MVWNEKMAQRWVEFLLFVILKKNDFNLEFANN